MSNARKVTNQLLESIDDGLLTNKTVLEALLKYLSEDQVAEFYQSLVDEGHPLPKSPRADAWEAAMESGGLSVTALSNDSGTGLWDK